MNFKGLGTKTIQLEDIKLTASGIKFGDDALRLLGHKSANNIFIDQEVDTDKFWVASLPVSDAGTTPGRKLSKHDSFTNKTLHTILGGQYAVWKIDEAGKNEFNGVNYFPITEAVNGARERQEAAELAGMAEVQQSETTTPNTTPEPQGTTPEPQPETTTSEPIDLAQTGKDLADDAEKNLAEKDNKSDFAQQAEAANVQEVLKETPTAPVVEDEDDF